MDKFSVRLNKLYKPQLHKLVEVKKPVKQEIKPEVIKLKFEIINHCYRYSKLLIYQLSSLILYKSDHHITYSLYYCDDDFETVKVIDYFKGLFPENVVFCYYSRSLGVLMNRAIGRNESAKSSKADWVWFTDTDYLFGKNCFNNLGRIIQGVSGDFVWPQYVLNTDMLYGSILIDSLSECKVVDVDWSRAVRARYGRAIGGIQIARGDVVREIGYCPNNNSPCSNWYFRSDVQFRRCFKVKTAIELCDVLRIRHPNKGSNNQYNG